MKRKNVLSCTRELEIQIYSMVGIQTEANKKLLPKLPNAIKTISVRTLRGGSVAGSPQTPYMSGVFDTHRERELLLLTSISDVVQSLGVL